MERFLDAQLDHVWPQTHTIAFPAEGFADAAQYSETINRLGNLALLESRLNQSAQNKPPSQKAKSVYQHSTMFKRTASLGFQIEAHGWTRSHIEETSQQLVEFAMNWWGASRVVVLPQGSGGGEPHVESAE